MAIDYAISRQLRAQAVLTVCLLLFLLSTVQAFERIVLEGDAGQHPLGDRLAYLVDPHGDWTIADVHAVRHTGQWHHSDVKIPNFGLTDAVYWFAVELENSHAQPIGKLLEIAYPLLDSIDLYLQRGGMVTEHLHAGDRQPFADRLIEHRQFVFPISMAGHEVMTLYLRVQTSGSLQVPITLWSEQAFWQADQFELLAQGPYFGIMLVMILYNLFIFTAVRDRSYVYYVLFVACFALAQLILHGFAFQFLWPAYPWLNEKIWVVSMNTALMFSGLFTNSFLGLKQQNRFFHHAVLLVAFIAAANAVASLVIPYRSAIFITVGISLFNCFLFLTAGGMMWRRGYVPARYYTVAWAALVLGTVAFVTAKLGIIPRTLFSENAMQGGATIEVILLSFALANRINVARREKELAQAETVRILRKYRALYENAIEGIFRTTLDFAFSNANRAMLGMLGVHTKKALLTPAPVDLRQIFSISVAADDFCRRLEGQHEIIGHEFRGKRLDGSEFWASLSMRTVYGDDGEAQHYEGSLIDVTERREAEEQVRILAYYDHVTGLPNRALLYEHVRHALVRAKRNETPLAILFVDLNRFKLVNDTFGHDVGDQLLREVATRLSACLRGDDWVARPQESPSWQSNEPFKDAVARLGGDEFVMVLSDIRHVEDAALVAHRVGEVLAQPFVLEGRTTYISASIGISTYPVDGEDPSSLLKNADAAMYHAKKQGKNKYQFYAKYINDQASKRLALEASLRHGLSQGHFQLHYQPKMDLASGRICGTEALCRWWSSGQKLMLPNDFIHLAEDSGIILELGEWVLRTACEQNKAWQLAGFTPARISVNLSARQFQEPDLVQKVSRILQQSGLNPAYLELEVTESILMDDTLATGKMLAELKAMGVAISIDDFGTGYSSLSYLKRFPVDVLKIDRCFIQDIPSDADNRAITAAIISMAKQLSLQVIAEGVETSEQLDYLRACGCQEVQGYLISTPLPADELDRLFQASDLAADKSTTS